MHAVGEGGGNRLSLDFLQEFLQGRRWLGKHISSSQRDAGCSPVCSGSSRQGTGVGAAAGRGPRVIGARGTRGRWVPEDEGAGGGVGLGLGEVGASHLALALACGSCWEGSRSRRRGAGRGLDGGTAVGTRGPALQDPGGCRKARGGPDPVRALNSGLLPLQLLASRSSDLDVGLTSHAMISLSSQEVTWPL